MEYFKSMTKQRERRSIAEHRGARAPGGDRPTHPPVAAAVLVLGVLALLVLLAVASSF
ncbi:MAG: hypothetical protein ACK4V6_06510 [Microthrixaceae bacterium]